MRQHTPRPWKMERVGFHDSEKGMAFRILGNSGDPKRYEIAVVYYKPCLEEAEANARLIVKAPEQEAIITELVRALEAMLRGADLIAAETLDGGKPFPTLILASVKAQAAIAEAKVTP